jgi:hypothetical protein
MMARLPDALMAGQASSRGRQVPQLDVQYGGMNGFAPNYAEHISQTHYVRKDLIALLIEIPRGFMLLPEPDFWISTLKSMVELHAMNWDGLQSALTVETASTPVGGAGEQFDDPTNVTRAKSDPTCTVRDMYGRPFQNMLHDWITYLIMDPDTKTPMISTIAGQKPKDWLADMYSCTVLFMEPDPTHTQIAKAWLTTNMFPKTTGDINGKRDRTAGGETLDLSIQWSGITQTGMGVVNFAQTCLDQINLGLTNANPGLRQSFLSAINSDVAANFSQAYAGALAKVGEEAVQPS